MNSPNKQSAHSRPQRRQPPLAWAGSICLLVGIVLLGVGLVLLSNDHYAIGWVLIAVGGAIVLTGALLLVRHLRPGKITV